MPLFTGTDGNLNAAVSGKAEDPSTNSGISNGPGIGGEQNASGFTDNQLLDMWKRWKKESFDQRWIFERQWMRNVWYVLNRQWIYFDVKRGQWQDKRLAKWIPRPVTNILKDAVQTVRANFASIGYAPSARPLGEDNESVVTAGVVDDYSPVLFETHKMDDVLNTADAWMLITGNAWLHPAVDYSFANGTVNVRQQQCAQCGEESSEVDIANNKQSCPFCQGQDFQDAIDETTGQPKVSTVNKPKPTTYALSPFEMAFPIMNDQFDDVPYIIRMRWRDKSYYEQNPEMVAMGYDKSLSFSKTPQERTMQIFKTLPFQSDLGIAPPYFASGGANVDTEGVVEYDIWVKPCKDFPDGQVIRIASDGNPTVIHSKSENLPGPLPYKAGSGEPIFPFYHMRYEQVPGRIYGSSLIDPAIQKQDQLNQIDSHFLMILGRMANPVWLEPKGAEVEKFTGEPGLVVKWNPLLGNNAEPKRIPGEGINETWFQYRSNVKQEAEELMGTFDILKGQKPSDVSAYAAMSLLLERGQAKHASAYKSRGNAVKGWFKNALELEREFGPDQRVRAIMGPNQGWAFKTFQTSDLSGNVEIIIEDGTMAPKTSLGERAAIDHLAQLGLINPGDPDQKQAIFQKFGQASLTPSLDAQVKEAWMVMDRFQKFLDDPQQIANAQQADQLAQQAAAMGGPPAPTPGPLQYKKWYDPHIHRQELIKWCLSDTGRQVFLAHPQAEGMVEAYLAQIDIAITQEAMGQMDASGVLLPPAPGIGGPPAPPQPGAAGSPPSAQGAHGRAQQMRNSNRNAAGAGAASSGALGGQTPPLSAQ